MPQPTIKLSFFTVRPEDPFVLICGPCVIESESHTLLLAEKISKIAQKHAIRLIFKASYDKANRSSFSSFRGVGIEKGLRILEKVKKEFALPVTSDIHETAQIAQAKEVLDVLQIPAFLCRQTDLIVEAAKTGVPLSIKKGQFLAPWDMKNVLNKAKEAGNNQLIAIERGSCFGYNNLVSDMRSLAILQDSDALVCYDATHSLQLPGAAGTTTGGQREFMEPLAKAAVAVGINFLFIEAHNDPPHAKSDSTTVISLELLDALLPKLQAIERVSRCS